MFSISSQISFRNAHQFCPLPATDFRKCTAKTRYYTYKQILHIYLSIYLSICLSGLVWSGLVWSGLVWSGVWCLVSLCVCNTSKRYKPHVHQESSKWLTVLPSLVLIVGGSWEASAAAPAAAPCGGVLKTRTASRAARRSGNGGPAMKEWATTDWNTLECSTSNLLTVTIIYTVYGR